MRHLILLCIAFLFVSSCKKDKDTSPIKPLYATRGNNPGIYDAAGRYVILRGVNYNVLGDYWQAKASVPATKSYSADDIRMMAEYGFNCIRLIVSWSALEPQRGSYNQQYIQTINNVIAEAATYNIYVMLDMHQDAWGKYIATPSDSSCQYPNKGWDGAPQWATITDGESTCSADGERQNTPAVIHSFQNFWDNTNGIQDANINAWKALVSATASNRNVLGYDLINEPSLGYKEPFAGEVAKLSSYYGRLTDAIRSVEGGSINEHIIFMEPSITWQGTGSVSSIGVPSSDFTMDNNIVAAPHHYFESIQQELSIEQGYELLRNFADYYQTTCLIGEWGYFGVPSSDVAKVKRFAVIEDTYFGSSTWWQWSQAPGDPHGISWDGNTYDATSLHLIELDAQGNYTGVKNELYLNVLSRTRPNAIAGAPTALTSNPDNGTMHLEATTSSEGTTELWIPSRFGTPVVSGSNATLEKTTTVSGGYIASVKVNGSYTIDVSF